MKKRIQTWVNAESEEVFWRHSAMVPISLRNIPVVSTYISLEKISSLRHTSLLCIPMWGKCWGYWKSFYRPHNLYCIHPDAKQPTIVRSFQAISKCLDNIFVASKLEKVYYAHHTISDAQLNYMQDLIGFSPLRWRYTINFCSRELPLKANREIVQCLMKLNGYSAIESFDVPKADNHVVYGYVLSAGVVSRG